MAEREWTGLDPAQADGQACVICGRNLSAGVVFSVPVGRSHTGSQVFACDGECEAATAGAATLPLCVPVEAIDALCDATAGFFRAELAAAVQETVAPLIVAVELRRLADEHAPELDDPRASLGELTTREGIAHLCAVLRERAAELDPTGDA